MDSVSQLVLGAAVGIAVMGKRTPVWKSALAGAVCGTLPDLGRLNSLGSIKRGCPLRNTLILNVI